jgi:ubiquinone/menaquinone biosynthesis C-methylase UbiE
MRSSLITILACPDCRGDLRLAQSTVQEKDGVFQGVLRCSGCGREFPIEDGILRAMPSSLIPEQSDEIKARDEQVTEYDNMVQLAMFSLIELPITFFFLKPRQVNTVLEAGCGTGRMTKHLSGLSGHLVSVDFSFESLRVNRGKLVQQGVENVDLIQADLCHLPFKDEVFDRVLSSQVLEHVPGEKARQQAVDQIARCAREGATVVISAYQFSSFTPVKEGKHEGGIPFFRFTKDEIRSLLSSRLRVDKLTSALVYIHLVQCVKNDL